MEVYQKEIVFKKGRGLRGSVAGWAAAWLLAAGTFLCITAWMDAEISLVWTVLALGMGAGCIFAAQTVRGGRILGCILLMIGGPMLAVWFRAPLVNGFAGMLNQAVRAAWRSGGLRMEELSVRNPQTLVRDEMFVLTAAAFFFGMTAALVVQTKGLLGLELWFVLWLWGTAKSGKAFPVYGTVSFFLGVLLSFFVKRGESLWRGCLFGGLGAAVGVLVLFFGPWKGEQFQAEMLPVKGILNQAADEMRFGGGKANTLPKGKLTQLRNWEGSETTALEVTMEEPHSMYLKGFVGGSYEGSSWEPLESSVYYENKDLFYWLSKEGFFPAGQLEKGNTFIKEETQTKQVDVSVKTADREFCYVPYELSDQGEMAGNFGDVSLASRKPLGEKNYGYEASENLVKSFPDMAAQLYILEQQDENTAAYETLESYYNAFVYEQYLAVPEVARHFLKQELGNAGIQPGSHADYYSAIQKIRSYLEKHITYSLYTEGVKQGQDFILDFLGTKKSGYSVHYATAAAMMFRYYGIPSRYVEGYLITPERAEEADAGGRISVQGQDGHAWCEIYVDGLGWVPVEMTPAYYGVMEEPDFTRGIQTDAKVKKKTPPENYEPEEPESQPPFLSNLPGMLLNLGRWLLYLLFVLDLLLLLFFLGTLVRRVWKKHCWKKEFNQADENLAVRRMIYYTNCLLVFVSGEQRELNKEERIAYIREHYSEELSRECRRAEELGEKAMFSPHRLKASERQEVSCYQRNLLKEIKKKQGWYEKWLMKYLECFD